MASEKQPASPPRRPYAALALTLLAPALALLAKQVPLPFVDFGALLEARNRPAEELNILTLGVTPYLTAAALVELFALLIPRFRHLRHAGREGRQKLEGATLLVSLGLAASQAYSIGAFAASIQPPALLSMPLLMVTLIAGVFFLHFLARLVDTRGLASGYVVLYASSFLQDIPDPLINTVRFPSFVRAAALFVSVALVVGLTWSILGREISKSAPAPPTGYRDAARAEVPRPIAIPIPASGLAPIFLASTTLAFPFTLGAFLPGMADIGVLLSNSLVFEFLFLAVVAVAAHGFSHLFNLPQNVAGIFGRSRGAGASLKDLHDEAEASLQKTKWTTLGFLFAILFLQSACKRISGIYLNISALLLATAAVLDISREWRARRDLGDLVTVWPEHRPYAIGAIREALAAANIPVHVRAENVRKLLQFFGPYAPMELMVPLEHEARAAKIAKRVLSTGDAQDVSIDESEPRARPLDHSIPAPTKSRSILSLAIIPLAIANIIVAFSNQTIMPEQPRPNVTIAFVAVNDQADVFDETTRRALTRQSLPRGVSFQMEVAYTGPSQTREVAYARIMRSDEETLDATKARFEAWLKTIQVPNGVHFGLHKVYELDEDGKTQIPIGWRTYSLQGAPVLNESDVIGARAMRSDQPDRSEWLVSLQFTKAGAERFESFTREHLKQRFAIVIDGVVLSVPLIQGPIPGGVATITMSVGDLETQKAEAMRMQEAFGEAN